MRRGSLKPVAFCLVTDWILKRPAISLDVNLFFNLHSYLLHCSSTFTFHNNVGNSVVFGGNLYPFSYIQFKTYLYNYAKLAVIIISSLLLRRKYHGTCIIMSTCLLSFIARQGRVLSEHVRTCMKFNHWGNLQTIWLTANGSTTEYKYLITTMPRTGLSLNVPAD